MRKGIDNVIGVVGGPACQALAGPIFGVITIYNTVISLNKSESHLKKPLVSFFFNFGDFLVCGM